MHKGIDQCVHGSSGQEADQGASASRAGSVNLFVYTAEALIIFKRTSLFFQQMN